jgi:hypothetical protein
MDNLDQIRNTYLREQIDLAPICKELEELNRYIQEEADFWEWYEDNYPHTRKELWDEYSKNK